MDPRRAGRIFSAKKMRHRGAFFGPFKASSLDLFGRDLVFEIIG
jgi:hypothetical protein